MLLLCVASEAPSARGLKGVLDFEIKSLENDSPKRGGEAVWLILEIIKNSFREIVAASISGNLKTDHFVPEKNHHYWYTSHGILRVVYFNGRRFSKGRRGYDE